MMKTRRVLELAKLLFSGEKFLFWYELRKTALRHMDKNSAGGKIKCPHCNAWSYEFLDDECIFDELSDMEFEYHCPQCCVSSLWTYRTGIVMESCSSDFKEKLKKGIVRVTK